MTATYRPRRTPQAIACQGHGVPLHVTHWPGTGPPLVLLHGYLDCGETFQFVVDALASARPVYAPDWRGCGRSGWAGGGYWFPDYFADLEALLDALVPGAAVDLAGHSMGGNVALLFAGLRPDRLRRVVTLEGFGLQDAAPAQAPTRYRGWLDQLRQPETATVFPSLQVLAEVLRRRNPRLEPDRAAFVARAWAEELPDGRARLRADPAHRRVNPVLYRRAEAEACWREIRVPVAHVAGAESDFLARLHGAGDADAMRAHVPQLEAHVVPGAGHMLHHDQPAHVARLLDQFLDPARL